jgi:hypothetical protein
LRGQTLNHHEWSKRIPHMTNRWSTWTWVEIYVQHFSAIGQQSLQDVLNRVPTGPSLLGMRGSNCRKASPPFQDFQTLLCSVGNRPFVRNFSW